MLQDNVFDSRNIFCMYPIFSSGSHEILVKTNNQTKNNKMSYNLQISSRINIKNKTKQNTKTKQNKTKQKQ